MANPSKEELTEHAVESVEQCLSNTYDSYAEAAGAFDATLSRVAEYIEDDKMAFPTDEFWAVQIRETLSKDYNSGPERAGALESTLESVLSAMED